MAAFDFNNIECIFHCENITSIRYHTNIINAIIACVSLLSLHAQTAVGFE